MVVVVTNNTFAGGVDGMEAIRKDLESAVAVETTCEDEARVAVPIAEKAFQKEESSNGVEDVGSVGTDEVVKTEAMDSDEGKTLLNDANNVQCTEMSSEVNTAVPDEVQKTQGEVNTDGAISGPVADSEVEVSTIIPPVLSDVEVSTVTSDSCAEVEVSTSLQEDIFMKSKAKERQRQNAVESRNVAKVVNVVQ